MIRERYVSKGWFTFTHFIHHVLSQDEWVTSLSSAYPYQYLDHSITTSTQSSQSHPLLPKWGYLRKKTIETSFYRCVRTFGFIFRSVLGFLVPPEGSPRNLRWNYDRGMILSLILWSHHCDWMLSSYETFCDSETGSCDFISFESLRIFAIWWSSLLKGNPKILLADLTLTLILGSS